MSQQSIIEIQASPRSVGKSVSRKLRRDRQVPAVVYGPKVKNLSFSLDERDAVKYSQHGFENSLFTLKSNDQGLQGLKVLKKEIKLHPVTRRPIHVDFFAPDMAQEVRVWVEVKFTGKAEGTKEGGVFNAVNREIEIECLPNEIPEFFELDVTPLQLNESFHVSDLKLPSSLKLITSIDETLCAVAEVKEEVAAPVDPSTVAAAAAAPAAGAAAEKKPAEKK